MITLIVTVACIFAYGFFKKKNLKKAGALSAYGGISSALAWQLFAGGGTLEDPSGDGFITRIVREYSSDGPEVLFCALFAILLGWILPIYFARQVSRLPKVD